MKSYTYYCTSFCRGLVFLGRLSNEMDKSIIGRPGGNQKLVVCGNNLHTKIRPVCAVNINSPYYVVENESHPRVDEQDAREIQVCRFITNFFFSLSIFSLL